MDNPKRDRIENFESVNEAYVVEDYDCTCLIENIELLEQEAEKEEEVKTSNAPAEMSEAEIERIATVAANVVKAMSEQGAANVDSGAGNNTGTGSAGA